MLGRIPVYDYQLIHHMTKVLGHADTLSHLLLPDKPTKPASNHAILLLEDLLLPLFSFASHNAKDQIIPRVLSWVWRRWQSGHTNMLFQPF